MRYLQYAESPFVNITPKGTPRECLKDFVRGLILRPAGHVLQPRHGMGEFLGPVIPRLREHDVTRDTERLGHVQVPRDGWIGNDGIGHKGFGVGIQRIGFRRGGPRRTNDVLDHASFGGQQSRILGFTPDTSPRLDHPGGQYLGVSLHGIKFNLFRFDNVSMDFVCRNPDAVSILLQQLGQSRKG